MKKPLFEGAGVVLATPMTEDGINFKELGRLIDFQLDGGMKALIVCGIGGEGPTLEEDEFEEIIRFAKARANGRAKIIANASLNNTKRAAEKGARACEAGADGLLLVGPFYNRATQSGLVNHFTYIADRVKCPIILSDIQLRTGVTFEASTYEILSRHPNINGVKEVSAKTSLLLDTMIRCGDEFNIWSGDDDQIVAHMAMGARGVISVVGNLIPNLVSGAANAMLKGDLSEANRYQRALFPLLRKMFIEVNPTPAKTALRMMGFHMGPFRLPLCDMTKEHQQELFEALDKMNLTGKYNIEGDDR